MILYSEALQIIEQVALKHSMACESVFLESACDRILAEDILSSEDFPFFRNSAMDGFALCAERTRGASPDSPISFPVVGLVSAGEWSKSSQLKNELLGAIEIMTGAFLPSLNYDAVVKIEDVKVNRDSEGRTTEISIFKPIKSGENVRERGEVIQKGDLVISKPIEVSSEHLLALASLGISDISVRKIPKIAIVATGNELVPYREKDLAPGMIRNSTTLYLLDTMRAFGAHAKFYGIVGDHPSDFSSILDQMRKDEVDIIISTGAVSMGKYDFVLQAVKKAGAKVYFHKVAIRPGKPILFGEFENGPVIFGAPGNPISTIVTFRFFIMNYLRKILGLPKELPVQSRVRQTIKKPNGLRCFFRSQIHSDSGGNQIHILAEQSSSHFVSLLQANAWAILPEDGDTVEEGTILDTFSMNSRGFSFYQKSVHSQPSHKELNEKRCCL